MDSRLVNFLKDKTTKKNEPYTHTSKIKPMRSYFIDQDSRDEYYKIYNDVISEGGIAGITEKPEEVVPLLVDIDFKCDLSHGDKRHYKASHIRDIVSIYQEIIAEIVETPKDSYFVCCVLEKSKPKIVNGRVKDGFHLHFPNFFTEHWVQKEYIRTQVIERVQQRKILKSIPTNEPLGTIFDKNIPGVVWLMYGSRKDPESEPYLLSKCYNKDLELLQSKDVFKKKFHEGNRQWNYPRYLSLQRDYVATKLNPDVVKKQVLTRKIHFNHKRSLDLILSDLIISERLIGMVNIDRAHEYKDWLEMGWILFNIGEGHQKALDLWISFSKNDEKFEEGRCEKEWNRMEIRGYTIGTLKQMAQTDSPKDYSEFINLQINAELYQGISMAHNDIAKILHIMYENKYVCADLEKDIWYEFRGHRWVQTQKAVGLRTSISGELKNKYLQLINKYSIDAQCKTDDEKNILTAKIALTSKLIEKLKNNSFKNCVIKECMEYFYDEDFVKKMDENKNLLVFENGVYDAENKVFRNGRPSDYCTKSTNIYYHSFDPQDYRVKEMLSVLRKIHVDKSLFKFFEQTVSDIIIGGNRHKVFSVWTGDGDNGKSVLADLIEKGFGDYFYTPPTSLLTGKQADSSSATSELMPLKGARIAMVSETGNTSMNCAVMKKLTGGDPFYARGNFKEATKITPQFNLILHTNKKLSVDADDKATWNRTRELPFQSTFVKKCDAPEDEAEQWRRKVFPMDRNLKDKLEKMSEVFMWWLVEKFEEYGDNDLYEPEIVKAATAEYRRRNDFYMQFIEEKLYKTGDKSDIMNIDLIYNLFKDWFKSSYPSRSIPAKEQVRDAITKKLGKPKKGIWKGYAIYDPLAHDEQDSDSE